MKRPTFIPAPFGFVLLMAIMAVALISLQSSATNAAPDNATVQNPEWTFDVSGSVKFSSPVAADVDNDGKMDIVVATDGGRVIAIRHDGTQIFNRNVNTYVPSDTGSQVIRASPSVADIDNDGRVEIVISTGGTGSNVCIPGALLVLNHVGNIESGWPFEYGDGGTSPANCPDGSVATPALGDLDNDGDLEIVTGGFDKRIYAFHHTGELLPGFPPNSWLLNRFPDWTDQLVGKTADTIWSSPALADIDDDGFLDIVLGVDEGHFGRGGDSWAGSDKTRFGGNRIDYYCPYIPTGWSHEYCGGSIYVLDRNGEMHDGFPYILWEHVQSTPAIIDLNNDGQLDIVTGTGVYYDNNSFGGNPYSDRMLAIDGVSGDLLGGWNDFPSEPSFGQGNQTGAPMPSSPALGDIDGDGDVEVVNLGFDGKVYAFHHNGNAVSGFPMTPLANANFVNPGFNVQQDAVLGDYDGDGDMEIFLTNNHDINIIDGDGQQITATAWNGSGPWYDAGSSVINAPIVMDIDNDCKLELISAGDEVRLWELASSSPAASWPMFKQNSARLSVFDPDAGSILLASSPSVLIMHEQGTGSSVTRTIEIRNEGLTPLDWSASKPSNVTLNKNSGTLAAGASTTINVTISTSGRGIGEHSFGNINFIATDDCGSDGTVTPEMVPVKLFVVADLYSIYTPLIVR